MVRKELSVTENYVKDWKINDGLRELLQNAIDQEVVEGNFKSIEYDEATETLKISNKTSILKRNSLLFGETTKSDDDNAIGCFGEGYKLALLVLTRNDKPVTIYNYGAKEVWKPKFINSRTLGAKVLVVDIDKYVFKKVPNNNLTFEVQNISKEDYENFLSIWLQEEKNHLETEKGNILFDDEYKGKIYVNNLYVTSIEQLTYGYNIKPKYLSLGRDRNLVRDFDILYEIKDMVSQLPKEPLMDLILKGVYDVQYLINSYQRDLTSLGDNLFDKLSEQYNTKENVLYITSQSEAEEYKLKYGTIEPIIVSKETKDLLEKSQKYKKYLSNFKLNISDSVEAYKSWKKRNVYNYINPKDLEELDLIVSQLISENSIIEDIEEEKTESDTDLPF